MLQHARDFAAAGIPFVFDPGQGLPMFNGDELLDFMALADYACFNDYEAKLLHERTGHSLEQLAGEVKALIVTRGGEGSRHLHRRPPCRHPLRHRRRTARPDRLRRRLSRRPALRHRQRHGLGKHRPPGGR